MGSTGIQVILLMVRSLFSLSSFYWVGFLCFGLGVLEFGVVDDLFVMVMVYFYSSIIGVYLFVSGFYSSVLGGRFSVVRCFSDLKANVIVLFVWALAMSVRMLYVDMLSWYESSVGSELAVEWFRLSVVNAVLPIILMYMVGYVFFSVVVRTYFVLYRGDVGLIGVSGVERKLYRFLGVDSHLISFGLAVVLGVHWLLGGWSANLMVFLVWFQLLHGISAIAVWYGVRWSMGSGVRSLV